MNHRPPLVSRLDLDCRVHLGGRRSADQQGNVEALALHLAGHVTHFLQRWRDQATESDDIDLLPPGGVQNLVGRSHDTQVDDLIVVAAQHDAHDVLADVVYVTLDRSQQDLAGRAVVPVGALLRLDIGDQVGDRLLHDPGALDHLRQEHLAAAEEVADDAHAAHQRSFDHFQRPGRPLSRLLCVGFDIGIDAVHERVGQPLFDREFTP